MKCDKFDCPNDTGGRHSSIYGNICEECFAELVEMGPEASVVHFMREGLGKENDDFYDLAIARFNRLFPVKGK